MKTKFIAILILAFSSMLSAQKLYTLEEGTKLFGEVDQSQSEVVTLENYQALLTFHETVYSGKTDVLLLAFINKDLTVLGKDRNEIGVIKDKQLRPVTYKTAYPDPTTVFRVFKISMIEELAKKGGQDYFTIAMTTTGHLVIINGAYLLQFAPPCPPACGSIIPNIKFIYFLKPTIYAA